MLCTVLQYVVGSQRAGFSTGTHAVNSSATNARMTTRSTHDTVADVLGHLKAVVGVF